MHCAVVVDGECGDELHSGGGWPGSSQVNLFFMVVVVVVLWSAVTLLAWHAC